MDSRYSTADLADRRYLFAFTVNLDPNSNTDIDAEVTGIESPGIVCNDDVANKDEEDVENCVRVVLNDGAVGTINCSKFLESLGLVIGLLISYISLALPFCGGSKCPITLAPSHISVRSVGITLFLTGLRICFMIKVNEIVMPRIPCNKTFHKSKLDSLLVKSLPILLLRNRLSSDAAQTSLLIAILIPIVEIRSKIGILAELQANDS